MSLASAGGRSKAGWPAAAQQVLGFLAVQPQRKFLTRSFWANATYMEMILWAYDPVLAFQFLCLPEQVQHRNISTLRRERWRLPAEWVRHGPKNILGLPARYPRYDPFQKLQAAIAKLKPLT